MSQLTLEQTAEDETADDEEDRAKIWQKWIRGRRRLLNEVGELCV